MRPLFATVALTLLIAAPLSDAKSPAYKCKVSAAHRLDNSGQLGVDQLYKAVVGQEIILDRVSGRLTGIVRNANASAAPQVLDPGSEAQSFKAITVFRPYVAVDFIEVMEYEKGSEKPFWFMSSRTLLTGRCTSLG